MTSEVTVVEWSQLQPIIAGILFVATVIATAVVGVLFGTNKTLKDTVDARGTRISDLEGEVVRKESETAELRSETSILKSMVTGKVELVALSDLLDEHHRQATIQWANIDGHVQEIPTKLAAVLRKDKDPQ